VQELRPGLWRWTARHPDWTPAEGGPEGWEPEVAWHLYEGRDALVLFDPLMTDDAWGDLDRRVERLGPPHVLLTLFWHARSAQEIMERYPAARVLVHASQERRVRERAPVTGTFRDRATLAGGVAARCTRGDDEHGCEIVYWIPEHRALVAGDVLQGAKDGGVKRLPDTWLGEMTVETLLDSLRPLLELPVELVLLAHGEPVLAGGREALAKALES
jgi:glyoxylase-like metal-dependent hydrolase (beta-lactamase superfamily II)